MPTSQEYRELSVAASAVDERSAPTRVIGRNELVEALWVKVRTGSTRLSAPRKVGKTWFLNLALAMRPEWAGPTLFSAGACRSLREFVWELTHHLHKHKYVPDSWEEAVRHWYTQRAPSDTISESTGIPAGEDWEAVLHATCGILMEKGAADCPVLMIDELPEFLETLTGEWAETEAARLLEALHRLRIEYPALRMILSDAQGLQRVVDKLRRAGYEGQPLDDLPPFELPALTPADARYLAGCLLLGEQVPCTDIHAVADAVADACVNVPSAIRNTVDWMARFGEGPWSPERVGELPTTRDLETMEQGEPGLLEEHLTPFGPDDIVRAEAPTVGSQTDRVANQGFTSLFPFSLNAITDESALLPGQGPGDGTIVDAVNRSIVAGPLAERGTGDNLDPANRSFDWLDATLTSPHRKIVMDVRTALARGAQTGAPHHIVLAGPAGTGKSHTLALLAKGFAKGLGLSGRPRKVIYLAGSEHSAESPFDVLLECMQADSHSDERLRARLDRAAAEDRFEELMAAFRERYGGQCTIIAIEGLGTLLLNWNKNAIDNLRLFLDRHPSVIVIGTTGPEPLDMARFHGWVKERFRSCAMPDLDSDATRELLCALAKARGDQALVAALSEPRREGAIRTIHTLSGGNCRAIASLDRCLSVKGLSVLGEPVLQMTRGDLAPSYERRAGERAPQQYKILQALADHQGRAVNVTELARYMFLTPQAVSRQLQDLMRSGFLIRTQVGREICYELRDPLIRYVLNYRHGHDGGLPLLVNVIRRWHEVNRLYRTETDGFPFVEAFRFDGFVEMVVETTGSDDGPAAVVSLVPDARATALEPSKRIVSRHVLAGSPELCTPELERQVYGLGQRTEEGFATIFHAAGLLARGHNCACLALLDECLRSTVTSKLSETMQLTLQSMRVYVMLILGRFEGAVAAADAVLRLTGMPDTPTVREGRAMTMINKGVALLKMSRFEDAAAVFDDVVGISDPVELPELVAAALLNRGAALERLNRFAEAIAALDLVSEQFRRAVHGSQRSVAATARVAKARLLERLGQHAEAVAACNEALEIRPGHPRASVMRALFLCGTGQEREIYHAVEAALRATVPGECDRALLAAGLFERMTSLESTVQVAAAIFGRDRLSLLHGLILWTQGCMSKPGDWAKRVQRRLHTLRAIFDDDAEAALVLAIAETRARMSQDEARAALDLPIELRRLLPATIP